ncbi:TcpE family conjugal transfer membrane protein [Priestia aryabhattai]|uniref:TcpE family conjugal transfer membrane protein n=1 Tax=Priestia aryabhattai TaxID=412384 RepID=UPI003D26963B
MERETNHQTTKMYVVTNMTKINRKIYSIFKINVGRAIPLRSLIYFLVTLVVVFILRHIPLLNYLFLWIPFTIAYIGIPIGVSYLLGGISSEERTPLAFFKSFFSYYLRQQRHKNFFRGKEVEKPVVYRFRGMPTYQVQVTQEKKEVYSKRKFKFKGFPSYQSYNK